MRVLFMLMAMAVIFPFCTRTSGRDSAYTGTWELKSADGMMGHKEYQPGNGFKLEITKDSIHEYANGSLEEVRAFTLLKDTLRGFGDDRLADKLSPDIVAGLQTFFELDKDTLRRYVGIPALDGGHSVYVRVK